MPVANHHVFRNQIHRWVSIVATRFPFSQTRKLAIEQAVSPQPQLPLGRLQMIADRADFVGEEFGLVAAFAARALVFADVENLIHPGVKSVGLKGVTHLVNEREHDLVNLRVTRTIALAV